LNYDTNHSKCCCLCRYNGTSLKQSLGLTETCLLRKTFSVPKVQKVYVWKCTCL
jgi:hypothetical protein